MPPNERDGALRTELALALYNRQVLSGGMACKLARLTRWEFENLLGQRRIPRHYNEDDLNQDLRYGQGG